MRFVIMLTKVLCKNDLTKFILSPFDATYPVANPEKIRYWYPEPANPVVTVYRTAIAFPATALPLVTCRTEQCCNDYTALFLYIMLIQHKLVDGKGMFYVGQDGAILAEMVYAMSGNKMIIEHTEVDDTIGGQGVGTQLVFTAAAYARKNDLKIVPLCSFAKAVLAKAAEWQDVLA
jgi:uncharacterized protein